jgi:hypothetical protein
MQIPRNRAPRRTFLEKQGTNPGSNYIETFRPNYIIQFCFLHYRPPALHTTQNKT